MTLSFRLFIIVTFLSEKLRLAKFTRSLLARDDDKCSTLGLVHFPVAVLTTGLKMYVQCVGLQYAHKRLSANG